jgi:2-dehydropantoate 2-reductase
MPFLRRYAIIDVEIASGGIRVEIKTAAAIGMGAVGTVYAKRLYDQYGSHFFAIADHERAERLRSSGVTLDGEAFFPQICEPEQADGAVDLILICVKNDQLEPAIASIRPFVERHTILLPLLNGVTATQRLRAAFPENTVLCGLAMALDAVRTESSVVHSSDGEIQFGMEDTVCYLPQVTAVDQFLCNAGIQTHVFPHMQSAMWKKWMLNVGLNQISALTGATYGDFTRLPEVMELAKSAMREVVHIAQAASVALSYEDIETIPSIVATLLPDGKTSMLQDIEAGRIMLQLDSYSTSLSTDEENLNLALLRANEVKKAIAWRRRLTDRCFVVHTHSTLLENTCEVVTVRLLVKVGEKQGKNVALSEVQDPKKTKVRDHENSSVLSENNVVTLPLASVEVSPVVKL